MVKGTNRGSLGVAASFAIRNAVSNRTISISASMVATFLFGVNPTLGKCTLCSVLGSRCDERHKYAIAVPTGLVPAIHFFRCLQRAMKTGWPLSFAGEEPPGLRIAGTWSIHVALGDQAGKRERRWTV